MSKNNERKSAARGGELRRGLYIGLIGCLLAGPVLAGSEQSAVVITAEQPVITAEQPVVTVESGPDISLRDTEVAATAPESESASAIPQTALRGGGMPGMPETAAESAMIKADVALAVTGAPAVEAAVQAPVYSMSASANPEQYARPGRLQKAAVAADVAGGREASAGAAADKEGPAVPYALVLALIALISLVPVSRRNY